MPLATMTDSPTYRPIAHARPVSLQPFADVIASLRAPDGCAWDRKQTHASLRRYLIEEAAELADAIDDADDAAMREELGDVLLQVVLHAQIADERGAFTLQDVVDGIRDKMVRRHPHVFDPASTLTASEVEAQWQASKRAEGRTVLGGVARSLPPLERAHELAERAAKVGFDFGTADEALRKVDEEEQELRAAVAAGDASGVSEELGDVLFAWANVARLSGVRAADALRATTDKFQRRFGYIERRLAEQGRHPDDASLAEMDALWDEAKQMHD